jgi:proliferating cell nuclear antigen
MTIIDEALFDAGPQSITFRSMDPSHIALIDIYCPSSAFEKYHCDSTIKFGARIDEFAKIIKRANANDSIEIDVVQDNSSLNIKTQSDGGYLCNYKMRVIESTGNTSPLPQMTFDSKIVIEIATLDKILSDVGAISEKITIDSSGGISTNKKTVIFSGDSDRGEARVTMDANDDKSKIELLEEITVKETSKSTYNIDFISKIIRVIDHQSSNLVTIEYPSNKPLRLEFLLSGIVKLQFYLAPRVQD